MYLTYNLFVLYIYPLKNNFTYYSLYSLSSSHTVGSLDQGFNTNKLVTKQILKFLQQCLLFFYCAMYMVQGSKMPGCYVKSCKKANKSINQKHFRLPKNEVMLSGWKRLASILVELNEKMVICFINNSNHIIIFFCSSLYLFKTFRTEIYKKGLM